MIQKKSFLNTLKRALQTGVFNYVGQQISQFPPELFKIDTIQFQDQSWWDCLPLSKMDLSNNLITQIPEPILQFLDLQVIRLRSNQIEALPPFLKQLQILKMIDLSKNKIASLPKELSNFPSIVELNFSQNQINNCPDLSSLTTLELLFLSQNKLKKLPQLPQNIRKVEASSNQIQCITFDIFAKCSKLQTINLNKNAIQMIAQKSFKNLINLASLELKQNRLTHLSELPLSNKLDTIILAFNRLTEFSAFSQCPNLTVLILSDNKLKSLSSEIIKLSKLKTLDLSNNDLPDLPSELGFIDSLVRIQLEGNPLKAIRQNIRAGGTNMVKKYLKDRMDTGQRGKIQSKQANSFQAVRPEERWIKLLNQFTINGELVLRSMELQQLDDLVFERQLKILNVSENRLKKISQKITLLNSLKSLIVNANQLSFLPKSLSACKNLQVVEAKNNKLEEFPPFQHHPYFPSLTHLDLSCNKFSEIPRQITYIENLRTLHFCFNKINTIEVLLHDHDLLQKLQILDVSSNQINDISDRIYIKHSLNYLNLQNNNLSKLPTVLGFMKLLGLKVDGNPLKMIKRQVIEKGTIGVMDYLRTKHVGDPPAKIVPKIIENSNNQIKKEKQNYQNIQLQKQYQDYSLNEYKKEESAKIKQIDVQKEKEKKKQIQQIQFQMRALEQELQNNMTMNNIQKNDKKKKIQALMIQRNKLVKG